MVDPAGSGRRTPWGTAWRCVVALLLGSVFWGAELFYAGGYDPVLRFWLWVVDPLIGVASIALVLTFSRRFPVRVALIAAVLPLVSAVAVGGALLALGTVATRLRTRETVITGAATLIGLLLVGTIYPTPQTDVPWWVHVIVMGLGVAVVVAVGIAIGQRRSLVAGLRERADAAERAQQAREAEARADERTRIAHDMHDVVAHRISLVAMHAAALGFRPDIDEDARQQSVRTIEDNARLALEELREVLGVLSPNTSATTDPPRPSLATVRALVEEGRAAGMTIDLRESVESEPPTVVTQTAFRVVREALTNARKHAEGAAVIVSIAGEPGDGLAVRVRNAAIPLQTAVGAPERRGLAGSGLGLIGLRERVARTGGRIEAGPTADGGFEIAAWVPWAP